MHQPLISFIREQYQSSDFIPLHAPLFAGNECDYVVETIKSTFVSSVGAFVDRFERDAEQYTGAERAVATVNGTAALHMALILAGVEREDLVLTQSLTFVATCNAIAYCGAEPVFIDVDRHTLGMSPAALRDWLCEHAHVGDDGVCRTRTDARPIRACLPMHTFGHPADMDGLVAVCAEWRIALIEDAAESLGSLYKGRHTGTIGLIGTLSFNGNKIVTTGGGGMLLTNATLGLKAKYLTTTAKRPHAYEFYHEEIGYNYRLPNLNAALGCAQLEKLEAYVLAKRALAEGYAELLKGSALQFVTEPEGCRSNYWLNAVICEDSTARDELLKATNDRQVMTRPIWTLMSKLPMYAGCRRGDLSNSEWLEQRVVNLPSSVSAGMLR
jgi:aminotransferase in exopolysaccharide biosynthesis